MTKTMMFIALVTCVGASAQGEPVTPPQFVPPPGYKSVTQKFDHTITGQEIVLPGGPVVVAIQTNTFPAGFHGPWHKQVFPRYAYILEGRLRVTYEDGGLVREFGPGDVMAEGIDQWHHVDVISPDDVKLVVIDQTPPGAKSVVLRPPITPASVPPARSGAGSGH